MAHLWYEIERHRAAFYHHHLFFVSHQHDSRTKSVVHCAAAVTSVGNDNRQQGTHRPDFRHTECLKTQSLVIVVKDIVAVGLWGHTWRRCTTFGRSGKSWAPLPSKPSCFLFPLTTGDQIIPHNATLIALLRFPRPFLSTMTRTAIKWDCCFGSELLIYSALHSS